MTNHGSPYPPAGGYGPPGGAYGPPSGGYGPPGGGYGPPPGGTVAPPRPAAALWPIVVVTLLFALFGLIPTIIASNKASQRREPTSRYWVAFGVSFVGSVILYVALVLVLVFFVLAGTVAVVGAAADVIPSIGQQDSSDLPRSPSDSSATPAVPTTGPCHYTPSADVTAATLPEDPATTPTATRTWTLVTSAGTVVVRLDAAAAPCTVQSIVHLTQLGFYDGTECPRSVDQVLFLLQCGDPSGTGAGGPGYTFGDENLPRADYRAGAVGMASSGAGTNGSQFFLLSKDATSTLQKRYTVFGQITSGQDVVDKIVAAGNDGSNAGGDGRPTPPVTLVTATVS